MRCRYASLALLLLSSPLAAQDQLSPATCFPNDPYAAQRWNKHLVPCYKNNDLNRCFTAANFSKGKCNIRVRVQRARILYNNRDLHNAFGQAHAITREDPSDPDAWIIVGLSADGAIGGLAGNFELVKQAVTQLQKLSLTPTQAAHRDAIAQRVAAIESRAHAERAAADAKTHAATKEAIERAKKACGWFCHDLDRQYYEVCYRIQITDGVDRAVTDRWCSCSQRFYRGKLNEAQFSVLVQKLQGHSVRQSPGHAERAGGKNFAWLDQTATDMDLITLGFEAQLTCSR